MKFFIVLLFASLLFAEATYDSSEVVQRGEKFFYKNSKELITGVIISKYESGFTQETLSVVDGVPNGVTLGFYPSGKKQFEFTYKDGIIDGEYKKFYENGALHRKISFIDDKVDGLIYEYKKDGSLMKKMTPKEFMGK